MKSFYPKINLTDLLDKFVDLGMLKTGITLDYNLDLFDFLYLHKKIVTKYNKLVS